MARAFWESGGLDSGGLLLFQLVDAFRQSADRLLLFVDFCLESFEFLAGQTAHFVLEGRFEIRHNFVLSNKGVV